MDKTNQDRLLPHVIGDPPKTLRDKVTVQCSECEKIYTSSAHYVIQSLRNNKVSCNRCNLRKAFNQKWQEKVRPFLAQEMPTDQRSWCKLRCSQCSAVYEVRLHNFLRRKNKKYFGWCRSCVQRTPEVSKSISMAQTGKTISHSEETKIKLSKVASERWKTDRSKYIDSFDNTEDLIKLAKQHGFIYLGKCNEDHLLECSECCTKTKRRPGKFYRACIECLGSSTSRAEQELKAWVSDLGFLANKVKVSGKEIDIFIEECGVGIEYCGLYWHCEANKPKSSHISKLKVMEESGYRLITIFEDEWECRKPQVKNFLLSVFGKNNKIFARNCSTRAVNKKELREFLDKNHIIGLSTTSKKAFGLEHAGELVGVMSFGRHHRNGGLTLDRLCFASGVSVVGGSSKLFKSLIEWARNEGYSTVISWSDNRWSKGGIYQKLGFRKEAELKPDYSYVRSGKRFSKQTLRKSPEEQLTGKTEMELRSEQGFLRIWDCGKIRWVYDILDEHIV